MPAYKAITPPNRIAERQFSAKPWWVVALKRLNPAAYTFVIPFLIIFIIFRIYPFLLGILTSFTNAKIGPRPPKFIGFDNYINAFTSSEVGRAFIPPVFPHRGPHGIFFRFVHGGLCQPEVTHSYFFAFGILRTLCPGSDAGGHHLELDVSNAIWPGQRGNGYGGAAQSDRLVEGAEPGFTGGGLHYDLVAGRIWNGDLSCRAAKHSQ